MSSESPARGIPIDAVGGPTIDPTKNVLDLVDAAVKRQDDLRRNIDKTIDAEHVSLKHYFTDLLAAYDKRYEQRFEASQKGLEAALAAADRAVTKAETASEKRFEGVNEFRAQLGDQQRTLMPRTEAEGLFRELSSKIGVLEGFRTEMLSQGRGAKEGYGLAVGVIGFVLTLLTLVSVGVMLFTHLKP